MDEALAVRLERERAVARRLYRFARAVRTACLDIDARKGSVIDLPPPCDVLPATIAAADARIAAQDPSLKALVNAIKTDEQAALPRDTAAPFRDMSLLQWWALFGDFEVGLQRRLGEEPSEPPQRGFFSKPRVESTNARHFREGRVELTRGTGDPDPNSLHPIAWYVKYAKGIDGRAVAEVLAIHGSGGWMTWPDALLEFYDAVTHAAAKRFVSSLILPTSKDAPPPNASDFAKKLSDSARDLGLRSEVGGESAGEIAISPCGAWPNEEPSACLRQTTHNAGRRILPIFIHARPIAYVRSLAEQPSWSPRISELMRQADNSWPEHDALGSWLAHEIREPTLQIADALAAIGGFLGRSMAASTDRSAGFSEGIFLLQLQRVLNRCGIAVVGADTASRRLANRFPQNGRWALSINTGSVKIPFGETTKATCPASLADAIDRYDQFAWSCATLADISGKLAWTEVKEAFLVAGAWGEQWETVKCQLLDLPQEPSVSQSIESFHAVRTLSVRLEQSLRTLRSSDKPITLAHETLHATRRLRDVVAALLSLAGANVDNAGSDLYPPRIVAGDLAGDVDIGKWLDDPWWYGGGRGQRRCELKVRASRKDAAHVEEDLAAIGTTFTLSLPFATPADAALIACPGALIWSGDQAPPGYAQIIHDCLSGPVQQAIRKRGKIDFSGALDQLGSRFAAAGDANHFHEMVERAIRGDSSASACLSILRSDSRSALKCYPEVGEYDGKWTLLGPTPTDTELSFCFSEKPRGETIQIRFATSRDAAKRVISRGPDDGTGMQALARAIKEWGTDLPKPIKLHATAIVVQCDRHELFEEPLTKGIEAAAAILHMIAQQGDEDSAVALSAAKRDEGFEKLKAWLTAAGGKVEPEMWSCDLGSDSIPLEAQESPAEFHDHVPEGRIVVKGFCVLDPESGKKFSEFQGCRSAGPPPKHYHKLLSLGKSQGGERLVGWLRRTPEKKLQGREPYRADVYELYSILSRGFYSRQTAETPEWDLPAAVFGSARALVEEWYEGAFDCKAFPKESDKVEVYKDIDKSEIKNLEPGEIEGGLVRVVVRGFRSQTGKILAARVYKEPTS
jgi:hypothetical protein